MARCKVFQEGPLGDVQTPCHHSDARSGWPDVDGHFSGESIPTLLAPSVKWPELWSGMAPRGKCGLPHLWTSPTVAPSHQPDVLIWTACMSILRPPQGQSNGPIWPVSNESLHFFSIVTSSSSHHRTLSCIHSKKVSSHQKAFRHSWKTPLGTEFCLIKFPQQLFTIRFAAFSSTVKLPANYVSGKCI